MGQFGRASGPNLVTRQSHHGDGIPAIGHELNYERCPTFVDMNYRPYITPFKVVIGKIDGKDYGIKFVHFIILF